MCEVAVLSKSIEQLSRRSFNKRLALLSPAPKPIKNRFDSLNRQLDKLYDLLYDAYPNITEQDYRVLGPYLSVLIQTLKELSKTFKQSIEFKREIDVRLRMNISAIEELDGDIRHFKINLPKNSKMKEVMAQLKELK